MKSINLMLLCSALIGSTALIAQTETESNFLKDYKAPDYKFRSLNSRFSSGGGSSKTYGFFSGNTEIRFSNATNKSNRQSMLNAYGSYIYVSRRYQLQNYDKKINGELEINTDFQNRFYLGSNFFIGLHADIEMSSSSLTTISSSSWVKNTNFDSGFMGVSSVGFGRVEPVRFAQSAWNVQNALIQSGSIDRSLSQDEIHSIGNEIAMLENRRYFDWRLQRIYKIEKMDSVLTEMGISSEPGIRYFTLMSDALLYSRLVSRFSGVRHELGIGNNHPSNNYENDYPLMLSYSFLKFKPLSNTLQSDFRISTTAVFHYNSNMTVNIDGAYEFGFYPNTRSYIGAKVSSGINVLNFDANFGALSVKGYYYISPRFRLSGQFNGSNSNSNNYEFYNIDYAGVSKPRIQGSRASFNFNLGLNYAIF